MPGKAITTGILSKLEEQQLTRKSETRIAETLESTSLCPVCCMKYNETTKLARSLHCGHSFCTECLTHVKEYGNSIFVECPTCRTETKCSIDKLPTNYPLMELLRNTNLLSDISPPLPPKTETPALGASNNTSEEETGPVANGENALLAECYRKVLTKFKNSLLIKFESLLPLVEEHGEQKLRLFADFLSEEIDDVIDISDLDSYEDIDDDDSDHTQIEVQMLGVNEVSDTSISFEGANDSSSSESSTSSSSYSSD